jgi:hypothetical protein
MSLIQCHANFDSRYWLEYHSARDGAAQTSTTHMMGVTWCARDGCLIGCLADKVVLRCTHTEVDDHDVVAMLVVAGDDS